MTDTTFIQEQIHALSEQIRTLAATADAGLSTFEVRNEAKDAARAAVEPFADQLNNLNIALGKLADTVRTIERQKSAVPNAISAALEPIVDEILNIERNLKADIQAKSAASATAAIDARNAATAAVLAAETALIATARNFAFGD